jgi:hypothetical protein
MKTFITAMLLFLAALAHAQSGCTALVYQGAPYSSLVTSGANATALVPLAGTVTLSSPLPANAMNLAVIPASWNFSNVMIPAIANINNGPYSWFTFSTDASGNITSWQFTLQWGELYESGFTATSTTTGDNVSFGGPGVQNSSIIGNSTTPGTWTCSPPSLQAELDTANQMIEALEAELNSMHANNVYMAKLLGRQ